MPTAGLLILTFIESFATILVERAMYFFCHDRLGFSSTTNLLLALVFGLTYVAGALSSHRVCARFTERRVVLAALAAQVVVLALVAARPVAAAVFVGQAAMGVLFGIKWPVIESYVSAGHTPAAAAKALGRFNLSWALAVPAALGVAGPLIAIRQWPWALFVVSASVTGVSLLLATRLSRRPVHLPIDHPARPGEGQMRHLTRLTAAARWLMLAAYSSMWILAAVMPEVFSRLGFAARTGTAMSSVLDCARLMAFAVLGIWTAWHGRRWPLVMAMVLLPTGFLMVLLAPNLASALVGEALFGWAVGCIYYAALYYAIIVKNASVDAGGGHESLIGMGFALGPAAGLLGAALRPVVGSEVLGILLVAVPLLAVCFALAARGLLRAGKKTG
jgi:MFS family permease